MAKQRDGKIAIIRCHLLNECVPISNVSTIFKNFHLVPTEHVLSKIVYRDLLPIVNTADFVVLVVCKHLQLKLSTILQCLTNTKTVITGNYNDPDTQDTLKHFQQFAVTVVDNIASYVHANFNYDSLSIETEDMPAYSECDNDLADLNCCSNTDIVDSKSFEYDCGHDIIDTIHKHTEEDFSCLTTIPPPEQFALHLDNLTDKDIFTHEEKTMLEPTYINTDDSKSVVVMRCILQDRCTWASNLLATLEEHNLTTTDFIIESNMLNLELPSVVSQSDFVILVICNHLNQNLRKIKRYLQTLSRRVIITGALHGPQIKDIFRDFTLFTISDIETITTHINISIASNIRESDNESLSGYYVDISDYGSSLEKKQEKQTDRQHTGFVHAITLTSTDAIRGTFVSVQSCFPKVMIRTDALENLKRRFYAVGNEEKKDLIKQIQNVTIKSLVSNSDFLGLITLMGIPDYHLQESFIKGLNRIQIDENIMSRCIRGNDLLTAAKWLLGIAKSNSGDSHVLLNLFPVTLDIIAMLYMSTLTMADLGDKLKDEIETFCEESEKTICSFLAEFSSQDKDTFSSLIASLRLMLSDFKSHIGYSTALQIGNLKDALAIPENRNHIGKQFDKTMCFLEQYTCLCLVGNQVMRTMDLHIIEFFYQLVRQFIRKARKKQNIEDVLFSALHFVTRIVVFRLETDVPTDKAPSELYSKLGKVLNLYLDNSRVRQGYRQRLLHMIDPLLFSNSQQIIVNTVYLLRKHDVQSEDIRNKLLTLVENKTNAINFKIKKPIAKYPDVGFKSHWVSLHGTIAEDIDVVLNMLVPTLSCVSKGDVDEYMSKSNKEETKKRMNELRILTNLQEHCTHRNIVQLLSFQCRPIPIFYITEIVDNPNLLTYLLNTRNSENMLQDQTLLRFTKDVLEAVLFLHDNHIIHRNLTCSAFSVKQPDLTVFLHDFSIASVLKTEGGYISDIEAVDIPVLWSAPESSFEDRYDTRTDGWMTGNVLYEVFTRGCHPYTEVYNTPTVIILEYVLFRDLKLYKWPCIPIEIHDIILDLTHTDPNERASISLAKTKLELFTKQHESRNQVTKINIPMTSDDTPYYPELDINQGVPETTVPDAFHQWKCTNGRSCSATKFSGNIYINTRISQRLVRNTLVVTPMDQSAPDQPIILKRYGFLDVREPVTLKFLRLLPNIDEETYKQILCLFESPQRHLTQTKQHLQHQNFSFYLKYKMVRGTNILDIAFAHQFGDPGVNREQYAQIVVKMAHFIHEMHRRRWIMGDICAENLYLSDDTGQVYMPRLGRMLFFEGTDGIEDCIVGNLFNDRRRWNPIEVLQHGQYSFESDIYRLAMSIYEFYRAFDIHSMDPMANQLHCTPFCNIENDELLDVLYNGVIPPRPQFCPDWLYGILIKCWDRDRTQRPSALWLKDIISRQFIYPVSNVHHTLFDKQLETDVTDIETPRPEVPIRVKTHRMPRGSSSSLDVCPKVNNQMKLEESSDFVDERKTNTQTKYGEQENKMRYRHLSDTNFNPFRLNPFVKSIKSFKSQSTNEAELNYASNYDKSLPMSNGNTHSNQNYFLQSSDMIDSPSNNVPSVRKDDFELDRNINQIDQKVPHFKNFVEELQYKIAQSLPNVPRVEECENDLQHDDNSECSSSNSCYMYIDPVHHV